MPSPAVTTFRRPTRPCWSRRRCWDLDVGVVDPRMAAEAVSMTFFQSVLKGLQRSPRIVTGHDGMREPGVITARDISCLVLPEGCLGLPTLAALEQGIPVIEVEENANRMRNDLSALPVAAGPIPPGVPTTGRRPG